MNIEKNIQSIKNDIADKDNIQDLGELYLTLYKLQVDHQEMIQSVATLKNEVTKSTELIIHEENNNLTLTLIVSFIASVALSIMLIIFIEFIRIGRSKD